MSTMSKKLPLTPDSVVQAAMAVADCEGLVKLSMRRLGAELGVEAMAIYHHFEDKEQLLEAMLNEVHAEIITPSDCDWRAAMYARAESVLEALERHPWAATIMESGVNPGPATMADREAMARCFRQAGFSIEATVHAITMLDVYVYGAAQQYVQLAVRESSAVADVAGGVLQKFSSNYPYFTELLAEYIYAGNYDPRREFYFGLDRVLDSIALLPRGTIKL